MASNGSREADPEEDSGERRFSAEKTGRAADFPDFAIIWSFLENFKHLLHFPDLSLDSLEDGFNSHSHENGNVETVEELYKKLLRRMGISVNPDKWEKSLLKAAREQGLDCAWDLEQFGYEELNVSSKLELFKVLLECQFDQNEKLKSVVNKGFEAEELRMQPIGRDLDGFIYWYHEDECNGVRLYLTEEDEVNSESWRLIAGLTDELTAVVEFLESKSEVNPKEIALARREEMKKKREVKNPGKKKGKKAKKQDSIPDEDYDDDNPCARCFSNVRPDSILLCDKCDAAYHTACLRPPLLTVPQGDWYCPFCQQLALLEVLREKKARLTARMRLRQRQAKRLGFAGIDLNNILEPHSDDEDDLGIRRSGRSRKTVDYTFKEFEDDITTAVENDRKRFNSQEEVNGDDHLLYSKPAFESGRLYGLRETRKSRRLRDLDYESDSDSRTSGYENEGNSDEDGQRISSTYARVKRQRRFIVEDDDDSADRNDSNICDKDSNELVKENNEASKEAEQGDQKNQECNVVAAETRQKQNSGLESGGEIVSSSNVQSLSNTRSDVYRVSSPQTHSTALHGNKIHPHSRIASVAPVTRNQRPNYPLPPGYNQQASFVGSSDLDPYEQQRFPPEHSTEYIGSEFAGLACGARDPTRADLGTDSSSPAGVGVAVVPGGRFVPGSAATSTNLGGSSFPHTKFGGILNPRTSFGVGNMSGGVSGAQYADANISGTGLRAIGAQSLPSRINVAAPNILRAGLATNLGRSDFSGTGYDAMRSPAHEAASSLWGSPNKPGNSSYSYSSFSPVTGTAAPTSSAAVNSPRFPSSYDQTAGYSDSNQYGSFNQQFQAGCHTQTNYFPSQPSGNYQGPGLLSPTSQRPPPPPYSATNPVNANFYPNNTQEALRTDGQWPYPEGYAFFPGQAMGQNF